MSWGELLNIRGFPPHGYCLLWDPLLIRLHVISDAVIGISYFSIPIALAVLLSRRRDIAFGWIIALFGIFIMACGTTHFMSILTLWVPAYGLEALVKAFTALVSVLTAIIIWPLLPRIIALPSPMQLQRANEELRLEAARREEMEEQLRQVRKLEAIGKLTGGIAHDFNNLLTVIMGNVDRAIRGIDDRERLLGSLRNAMDASTRAAGLVDQLLTFARNRPFQVETFDVNAVTEHLATLIDSSIGDSVELKLRIADRPLPVSADRVQFENALLNLSSNARDAMPRGGTLTIACERVAPDKVRVCVGDTGSGMDQETLERATEPFFTTKPIGQGTGLGLSQVYGFANQAGGDLLIRSEPGKGTSIAITLPTAEET